MKIYLYLEGKVLNFLLPTKISGSFSFDENPEELSKLINVEERGGKWVMYSTNDVAIVVGNEQVGDVILEGNNYYVLRRDNINYLIYVTDVFDNSFMTYSYNNSLNLIVGNDQACNVCFSNSLLNGISAIIKVKDGRLLMEKNSNSVIYVNNLIFTSSSCLLKFGDQLDIYGLKIIFLNGILLINNPLNCVKINTQTANIEYKLLKNEDTPKDIEVKDVDLYSKDEYFSKAPRLRRLIKTKEIKLSPPPKADSEEKMPLILTVGPMMTMGIVSLVMFVNVISRIYIGVTTLSQSWPSLVTSAAMILSMLVWPNVTRKFNKKLKERKKKEMIEKYTNYLNEKRKELELEEKLQREILIENLISAEECLSIIEKKKINFWDKRVEQNDFLEVRIGRGNALLDVQISYPEEGFTIEENELRKKADEIVDEFKYIENVPIGYSLYKNKITAVMGVGHKIYGFINNIILQLITFYSYEDVKLVVFTNQKNKDRWEYIKYLNHNFSNDKSIRFFSSCADDVKILGDFLNLEIANRIQLSSKGTNLYKPYYVILVDDYDSIKRHNFAKILTELDDNLGFSLVIIEDSLSKLPSKCNNFITLGEGTSGLLTNSFEQQEQFVFYDEINNFIDMMQVARILSNIPVELQEGNRQLPDSISFLEMEKVGKVEQLNILNRWNSNDPTSSLKAEVGVDEYGNLMYLDLHEKHHGPHGLVAGMTGSGKSEFIITYILSMAINYSPDEVAFVLIDYKGGGLAFAFENKANGISLPHLAGTITNLDKAEMDRTLVSIDSEIKRRQRIFNEARDMLGESTIDIYKYQRYFKEGRLTEPIPHLFIISDEFAELKAQQPEFMDNLISVARIGRSLGVHLILATQKPSGVVNDQIWSNTKFRVCLKVQDESDSKEMLKRPDAASLKQVGRYYLQVGYDEYFALGQSAWCGAKYYPSEKIIKFVDKSVNFIDDVGTFIKSLQSGNNIKIESQGEQLVAIMNSIVEIAKMVNKRAKRLWLNSIEPIVLIDNLIKKYNVKCIEYDVRAVIGEYDAPEKQEQGVLIYSLKDDGNTVIFGNDEAERESLLSSIIYSICTSHTASEINIYAIDYGSESLRMYNDFPQIGGVAYMGEDEKFNNIFKLITEEIKNRKKMFVPYGGSLEIYNNSNNQKLPQILFVINNYEAILEAYSDIYQDISSIGRECNRYGITLLLTGNTPSTLGRKVSQCFENRYTLHLSDPSDYYAVFNAKCRVKPRDIYARGLAKVNEDIYEFQTASIVDENYNINEFLKNIMVKIKEVNHTVATPIPQLPDKVTFNCIEKEVSTIERVPIGISKASLKIIKYDFSSFTTIASNKLININSFMDSLLDVFVKISNLTVFFIDASQALPSAKDKNIRYFDENYATILEKMENFENNSHTNINDKVIYIFYGLEKLKNKIDDVALLEKLFAKIKENDNSSVIFCDSGKGLKALDFDSWYSKYKNNTDGIWIGKGFGEQQNFRVSKITKEMSAGYSNNYGFCIKESDAELMKVLEFSEFLEEEEDFDEK